MCPLWIQTNKKDCSLDVRVRVRVIIFLISTLFESRCLIRVLYNYIRLSYAYVKYIDL
jgi:hypothetical protein